MALAMSTTQEAEWRARSREYQEEQRRLDEIERKKKVEALRAEAAELGASLMEIRNAKFVGEYAGRNPAFVSDPEIDVLEIRYRRAVSELEQIDVE